MSAVVPAGLCRRCARRDWLLSRLGDPLDALAADPARLWPTLELDDSGLIAALTHDERESSELHEQWGKWSLNGCPTQGPICDGGGSGFYAACRHHCRYPARLRDDPLAPHALTVFDRHTEADSDKPGERRIVAIAGARAPSKYGVDVARAFAKELAAAGVTIAGSESGVGAGARTASVEAGGWAICVGAGTMSSGAEGELAAERRERRMFEPVAGARARRWRTIAAERTLALIADLVLVAQAREHDPFDLACAEVARSRGVPVAAVPGPIDSPTSRGSNQLLVDGIRVVCGASEALDALFGIGVQANAANSAADAPANHRVRARQGLRSHTGARLERAALDDAQRALLDLLAVGQRTLAELGRELGEDDRAAVAIAELELSGLAVRGDDGRYRASHLR